MCTSSPNGRGVAFFLTQHKKQRGLKTVNRVSVFGLDDAEEHLVLVFHIGPVPRSLPEEEEEEDRKPPRPPSEDSDESEDDEESSPQPTQK